MTDIEWIVYKKRVQGLACEIIKRTLLDLKKNVAIVRKTERLANKLAPRRNQYHKDDFELYKKHLTEWKRIVKLHKTAKAEVESCKRWFDSRIQEPCQYGWCLAVGELNPNHIRRMINKIIEGENGENN